MEKYKELYDKYRPVFGPYEAMEMAKKERINELLHEIEFPEYYDTTHLQIRNILTVLKLMATDKYET